MCYDFPNLALNLPVFYRSLVSKTKDEYNNLVFDYDDLDQIVENALMEKIPIVTAKKWAISNQKRGIVEFGKNQEDQGEVASMTKVCTALTVCKIMEELGIMNIEMSKNIYLRVNKKGAYMTGTSAYV